MSGDLEVTDLAVDYGQVKAVLGVGFVAPKGKITALVGTNGAGKTSTMLAIYGVVGSQGSVRVGGRELNGLSALHRARTGIAIVPQGRQIFARLTVRENLDVIARLHRVPQIAVEAALDRFPILRERADYHAGILSGGEQQMLALTRALMTGPKILLLDEMMTGLAPIIVDRFLEAVRELADAGMTVVMSEPDISHVSHIIDGGYVLLRGRLVAACDSGSSLETAYGHALGLKPVDRAIV